MTNAQFSISSKSQWINVCIEYFQRLFVLAFGISTVTFCLCGSTFGDDTDTKKAMQHLDQAPWYDATKDELVTPDLSDQAISKVEHRNSEWGTSTRKGNSIAKKPKNGGGGTMSTGPELSFMKALLWVGVGLVLCAIVGALIWAFLVAESKKENQNFEFSGVAQRILDEQRIENLPVQLKKTKGDFLAESKSYYAKQNFREAVIYLFSHVLLQLDRKQWIRLEKGKTNRQYAREIKNSPELKRIFESNTSLFEEVFFGGRQVSKTDVDQCWSKIEEFERLVAATQQQTDAAKTDAASKPGFT